MVNTMTKTNLMTETLYYYQGVVRSFDRVYVYDNEIEARHAINKLVLEFSNEIGSSFTPSRTWTSCKFYEFITGRECATMKYKRIPNKGIYEITLTYYYF